MAIKISNVYLLLSLLRQGSRLLVKQSPKSQALWQSPSITRKERFRHFVDINCSQKSELVLAEQVRVCKLNISLANESGSARSTRE